MYMPVHKIHIDNALASICACVCVCVLPYLVAEHKTAQIIKISHILCGLLPHPPLASAPVEIIRPPASRECNGT